jgi:aminomuconate-semialdehyde/2-hydroxymuconate-6-semialdehyde dehydrogenase
MTLCKRPCIYNSSRIFVEESIHDKFVAALSAKANALVVGDPSDPKTNLGALVSKQHLEKVMYYVNLAREEGGTITAGGELVTNVQGCENGFFMRPTIITGYIYLCTLVDSMQLEFNVVP